MISIVVSNILVAYTLSLINTSKSIFLYKDLYIKAHIVSTSSTENEKLRKEGGNVRNEKW